MFRTTCSPTKISRGYIDSRRLCPSTAKLAEGWAASFTVLIKFLWYEQVCPNIHLIPSGGKFCSAQNYFQVIILFRELIVREVCVQNAVRSGSPPCKALQQGRAAENNLD